MENVDAHLHRFADRCFRDVADRDYINARMCYRAGLISQFHWAALQAFEKYYKAIFLYNRIKAKNIRHDLELAQEKSSNLSFEIRLSDVSNNLINHLNCYGRFRYLETSYLIHGPKLFELDKAVWELRRYCRVLDYTMDIKDKGVVSMMELELKSNKMAENKPPQTFAIAGGALEKIINNPSHPSRAPLIWQNGFYGSSRRKIVRVPTHSYAENSPLSLKPELLEYILEYVYLPKEVADAYRAKT